jgi:multisubunit Na+/H+ antiporter MnhE subunit
MGVDFWIMFIFVWIAITDNLRWWGLLLGWFPAAIWAWTVSSVINLWFSS